VSTFIQVLYLAEARLRFGVELGGDGAPGDEVRRLLRIVGQIIKEVLPVSPS